MKTIILFLLCSFLTANSAEIRGKVIELETGQAVVGANIFMDSQFKTFSDIDGNFSIENLAAGLHTIQFQFMLRKTFEDTFRLKTDETLIKTFVMPDDTVKLKTYPEYEAYHLSLQKKATGKDILKIKIKDVEISCCQVFLTLQLTNTSDLPIYIANRSMCWQHFIPIIHNSRGDSLKGNLLNMGCDDNPSIYPDSSDMLIIPPKSKIIYPKIDTFPIGLSDLPKDKYKIEIKYQYFKPEFLKLYFMADESVNSVQHVMNLLLRGEFKSSHSVKIKNDKLVDYGY